MRRKHASIELGVVIIVGWIALCVIAAICGIAFRTSNMHDDCIVTTSQGIFGSSSERTVTCP